MGATISGEIEWWGCRPGISAIQRGFRASDSRGRQQVSAASMSYPQYGLFMLLIREWKIIIKFHISKPNCRWHGKYESTPYATSKVTD